MWLPGRPYWLFFDRHTVANAAEDLVEINAPSDAVVLIIEGHLAESAGETAVQTMVKWVKGHTTSGSGGGTITPTPVQTGDAAFGGTVERNNTTIASAGTGVDSAPDGFDVRAGWHWTPTPSGILVLSPSERIVLRQPAGAGATWSMSGRILIHEVGG